MFLLLCKIEALQEKAGAVFVLFRTISQCLAPYAILVSENAKMLYGCKFGIDVLLILFVMVEF